MGTFTMPLKEAIRFTGGTTTVSETDGITRLVNPASIGLAFYTIFDPAYRDILNGKIVDHYWNREIGMESISLFQLAMRRRMNEIMPYYNKMYESTQIEFEPLTTMDIHTVSTGTVDVNTSDDSTTDATNDATNTSRATNLDMPQTALARNKDYASSGVDSNAQSTGTSNATVHNTGSNDTTADNDSRTTGYQGLASDLIMRYRESILNIDMAIINELTDCFMQVWDSSDEFYNNNNNSIFGGYYA